MTESEAKTPKKWPVWWKLLTRAGVVLGVLSSITGIAGFIMAFLYPGQFDQIMTTIRGANQEVVERLQEVEVAAAGAKRETSDDPRKELVNLGYSFDRAAFWRSVQSGDIEATRLFCQVDAGQFVDLWQDFFDIEKRAQKWSAQMVDVVTSCPVLNLDQSCRINLLTMGAVFGGSFDEPLYASLCGADALNSLRKEARRIVESDLQWLRGVCDDFAKGDRSAAIRYDNNSIGMHAPWRIEKFGQARFALSDMCSEL